MLASPRPVLFALLRLIAAFAIAGCAQAGMVIVPPDASCADGACGCSHDTDCTAGLHCQTSSRRCVHCLDDSTCAAAERCDPMSGDCVPGCAADHGCGDAGVCQIDGGLCVACLVDGDCHDPLRPRCDRHTDRCQPCLPSPPAPRGDCAPGTYCADTGAANGPDYACVPGCAVDQDCPTPDGGTDADGGYRGVYCDAVGHTCVIGCDIPGSCGACGNLCQGGWTCCNDSCSNPTVDVHNCGGCGLDCALAHATPACVNRACAVSLCDANWADCNGKPGDGCEVEIDNDVNDCGACSHSCSVNHAQPNCIAGQCGIDTCLNPYADCNNQIGDGCETAIFGSDVNNCGACGLQCSSNQMTTVNCTIGVCDGNCAPGQADCNMNKLSDGCEINTTNDPQNCGGCGDVCSNNNVPQPDCANSICDGACDIGFADCNHDELADGCEIDTFTDKTNCGGCGVVCSSNNMAVVGCTTGTCSGTCNSGFSDCNNNLLVDGCEINTQGDVANCGGCGMPCSNAHITTPTCVGGACSGACDTGFSDCDNNKLGNGCEINIAGDSSNCGGCNVACSTFNMATVACTLGVCNGTCEPGYADCDMNVLFDGCEVNTQTDPTSCGGCGIGCSTANMATITCGGGVCNGTCDMGFADCDMNLLTNGCEINTQIDRNNCGSCGAVCSTNNMATVACSGSACVGSCNTGFADCDFNLGLDGCEINTDTDHINCGGCGEVCSANHISVPTCGSGLCTGMCDSGFGDCDNDKLTNGCETPLDTNANCGACGNACGPGGSCENGVCTVCSVKVNELMTGTTSGGTDEFVEIYNPCPADIDMTNWRLLYRPASNSQESGYFTFSVTLAAGAYYVLAGANFTGPNVNQRLTQGFSSSGGAVGIRDASGTLVDSVSYQVLTAANTFTEGTPAPNIPVTPRPGTSLARIPDGQDTNNNFADFKTGVPTPGAANQ